MQWRRRRRQTSREFSANKTPLTANAKTIGGPFSLRLDNTGKLETGHQLTKLVNGQNGTEDDAVPRPSGDALKELEKAMRPGTARATVTESIMIARASRTAFTAAPGKKSC
jgi:hypothetical protein